MMDKEYLKQLVEVLPDEPGIYQFLNKDGRIIYIGKAKNLKKRVSSYFSKNHDHAKTAVLVRHIADIKHMVVDSETDALLLENNLIKKYQPRYNILLKDDKTYPWICVRNENFPRVFLTRKLVNDGSLYFGPYTSLRLARTLIEMICKLYQIRNCSLVLTHSNILQKKYKICLEHHIGNCKAPCVGLQTDSDYNNSIESIKHILSGNTHIVQSYLKEQMLSYASGFEYEKAQLFKEKIELLESYQSKSTIVNPEIDNVDVFSIFEEEKFAYVNFLRVARGSIIQTQTLEIKKRLNESKEELLEHAIANIWLSPFIGIVEGREIIVPFKIDIELKRIRMTVPNRGDKKKLLELSERNAKYYGMEKRKQAEFMNPVSRQNKLLVQLKTDLRLTELPVHIECFDNSNLQGTNPVSSCVVFINGKPSPKNYRHFNVKSVEGINDFASMEEVIYRRYKRLLDEQKSLPQLIIIDGGKGQLGAAVNSLEKLDLYGKIAIIGIAKRLEEIFFPGDSIPIYLDKKSTSLKIIQHARNEAHRFGITFHRNKRSKNFIKTELSDIKGIGEKLIEKLLIHFKTVSAIRNASPEELEKIVNKKNAQRIVEFFSKT